MNVREIMQNLINGCVLRNPDTGTEVMLTDDGENLQTPDGVLLERFPSWTAAAWEIAPSWFEKLAETGPIWCKVWDEDITHYDIVRINKYAPKYGFPFYAEDVGWMNAIPLPKTVEKIIEGVR